MVVLMRQRALVDINALLDTRLGVLARLDKVAANAIAHSAWYTVRSTDDWESVTDGAISNEAFKEMYLKYEVETLVESLMTGFIHLFRKDITDVAPELEIKGIEGTIDFDINVYPYKLLASEKEIIRRSIARYLPMPAMVHIVDTAYHLMTPALLDAKYDMMTIYNYEDWLKYHHTELLNNPIKEFTIFHPRISSSGVVPEPDDIFRDPFLVAPMVLLNHVQITPVPTGLVCWSKPLYDVAVNPRL